MSLDAGALFFVPDDTLVHAEADALDVRSAKDLFGGIVPHPFVKTKVISHGVLAPAAARPRGWSHAFADRIRDVVLPGYSTFARADARAAASRLLELGAIRAKPPRAAGGNGQSTLASMAEVEALLETLTDAHLDRHGLVLELCLQPVTTLSVGHVALDDTTIAYYGHQRLTRDNSGHMVYGGSDLTCVRGGWETLEGLALESDVRTAAVGCLRSLLARRRRQRGRGGRAGSLRPRSLDRARRCLHGGSVRRRRRAAARGDRSLPRRRS